MSQTDTAHAWWSRLRHQGLLLSPVVMVERYPTAPPAAPFPMVPKLRDARTRFSSAIDSGKHGAAIDQAAILGYVDSLLESFLGHTDGRLAKQHSIPEKLTAVIRIGSRSETIRPHRVIFTDDTGTTPAVLVMADTSPQVGRGRGRTVYSRFMELLRGTGHRLGLLTNGQQFRLIYAGLDFESWCEWESERWFDDGEGTDELCGLRQLLSPESLKAVKEGVPGLLDAVEESRKRQADLSSVLRENVRQAVELLLEEVSTANRTKTDLFAALMRHGDDRPLTDAEAHEALFQATVRLVMRLVVCLFAESRQLLPINDPIYAQSYGVRSQYELLDELQRHEGGTHALFNRSIAWLRLMALFRLIHGGSAHGGFPLRAYGGALFRPGDQNSSDPVFRALYILEHSISVGDATIYHVLRKLMRGRLPVLRGRAKTYVEGPVDYTDLRTEFIGLIYEGLLDYRLKRTDEKIGPQIFLNLGREPVLPLKRLEEILANDKKGLKDLLTTLRKEKVIAKVSDTENEDEDTDDDEAPADEIGEVPSEEEAAAETPVGTDEIQRSSEHLDANAAAKRWATEAVVLAGLVRKKYKKESTSQYQQEIEAVGNRLINKVVTTGEFYLVRAGNTRKGTGTFYTRPQLAVPTVHRTLEPLCYDKAEDGTLVPKTPEHILGLKVCDPACGSASFLVAALHYMTDALYKSLCQHRKLDEPTQAKKITLPYGRPRTNKDGEELVPFPPNDPQRGDTFADRIKALLRRHVVERCIYGVDINPLAVELARVSLWVETLDPELPFSFLDHKIKVGNSLVGCWFDQFRDYPIMAWTRTCGDDKHPSGCSIQPEAWSKAIKGRLQSEIKRLLRQWIDDNGPQKQLFLAENETPTSTHDELVETLEQLHSLPMTAEGIEEREARYYQEFLDDVTIKKLQSVLDLWCAIWFWPATTIADCPTPTSFSTELPQPTLAEIERLALTHRFFHWELEFPDVFQKQGSGFDAVVGNPPWETSKPKSQEFFTEFDPLFRTYTKEDAEDKQEELFKADPNIETEWLQYSSEFTAMSNWVGNVLNPVGYYPRTGDGPSPFNLMEKGPQWRKSDEYHAKWKAMRNDRVGYVDPKHPFRYQGGADVNLYKLFLEVAYDLLKQGGRLGFIVPSGLYTDAGCHDIRELFLNRATWDWLFGFINWEQIFNIYYRFKFVVSIATRTPAVDGHAIRSCFGRYKLQDWEDADALIFPLPKSNILEFSPKTLSILEIANQRDLEICRRIYANSFRIGDSKPGWTISYAREFDMTNDSKQFPTLEKWKAKGYVPGVFGQWIGPEGDVALPLYEGRMIGQFDFSQKGYVNGRGRSAVWRDIPFDSKTIEPQFLVAQATFLEWERAARSVKVGFMDVTSSTNARSFVTSALFAIPCGNKVPTLSFGDGSVERTLLLSSCCNSLACDFATRSRLGGITLNWFIVEELPLPTSIGNKSDATTRLCLNSARLTFLHRRFAAEWLRLKTVYPELSQREWKHWWSVTETDRLRLRLEIDSLCADLYGLDPDDFDWIVRDNPSDPKGFHRVDKWLPFRERFTGLAAAAFRALKEGKWPVESAATLSHDEFFALIGIPEMTTGSDPLIQKRDGCHRWKPEEFGKDDPRYGWNWDHCLQDAVALLGSEDAVRKYVEQKEENPAEKEAPTNHDGQNDLYGEPLPPKQGRLF